MTAAQNTTALEALAWASMNESAIVAKLATKYQAEGRRRLRRGRTGDGDYNMMVIRELVASTVPPRGKAKARCAAVVVALTAQNEKRSSRTSNKPIKWDEWKHPSHETRVGILFKSKMAGFSFDELPGQGATPTSATYMRRIDTTGVTHMFVTNESWHQATMFILTGGSIITWTIATDTRTTEMFGFICAAADVNVKRAVVRGASVNFDPVVGVTIVTLLDGSSVSHHWAGKRREWSPTGKVLSERNCPKPIRNDDDE